MQTSLARDFKPQGGYFKEEVFPVVLRHLERFIYVVPAQRRADCKPLSSSIEGGPHAPLAFAHL